MTMALHPDITHQTAGHQAGITHHPSDELLLHYAAGTLAAGLALVIDVHATNCVVCRSRLAGFEEIGGIMLENEGFTGLNADAFAKTMALIDQSSDMAPSLKAGLTSKFAALKIAAGDRARKMGVGLPRQLDHCEIGPWRWIGPGRRYSKVVLPEDPTANIMLLKVGPGRKMARHGHGGIELTQILTGAFSDHRGHYAAGDCDETDADVLHQPVVDQEAECLCLAVVEGGLKLPGQIGRAIQKMAGI